MIKLKISTALFLLISLCLQSQNSIIPTPVNYISQEGSFDLTPKTKVYQINTTPELSEIINLHFSSFLGKGLAVSFEKPSSNSKYISIELNKIPEETIGNEGYTLDVNENIIVLKANTTNGLFHALQTFDQLFLVEILQHLAHF